MDVRKAIIEHIKAKGVCPNYDSVGGYYVAKPVFDEMLADGTLIRETKVSPKGRKSQVIRLA